MGNCKFSHTIKVTKLYDQTGNARHLLQATLANMPVLNLTGFGSLPAIVFTAASSHGLSTSSTHTASGAVTVSMVANKATASNTQEAYVDGSSTTGLNAGSTGVTERIQIAGPPAFSNYFGGSVAEMGIWNSAFNSTQQSDMNTNQHGTNGYNF